MTLKTGLAVALFAALAGTAALAQDSEVGGDVFNQYCATCHGADAKGAGPLTEVLTTQVPDLTGLAARNDGTFPMLQVIHIIDGRTGVRSHGGPMPVYGDIFTKASSANLTYNEVIEARGVILSLAYYLESIQE